MWLEKEGIDGFCDCWSIKQIDLCHSEEQMSRCDSGTAASVTNANVAKMAKGKSYFV